MVNYEEIEVFRRSISKNEAPKMKVQFEEDFKSYRVVKKTGSEKRHRRDKHTYDPETSVRERHKP